MAAIVLTTLNARYYHCALSLRCIQANLRELRDDSVIREYVVRRPTTEIVDDLLREQPRIILLSIYIWNVAKTLDLMRALKQRVPQVTLIVGGPEVSYAPLFPGIEDVADYIVSGEGEETALALCRSVLSGLAPNTKFHAGVQADVETVPLPYPLYTDEDIDRRIVYLETSRGCPYRCEYCLSSLDKNVRFFPLDELLAQFQILLDRGVLLFKLLDRTFNTDIPRAVRILEFFLANEREGLTIHCELIPDRIPPPLKRCFQAFRPGTLQFEVGVQSFNQEILDRIQRAQLAPKVENNLQWLCEASGAVIHADLIFGLPGESLESMKDSFNRLVVLEPDQIQLNLLKLLKGTPIARHTDSFGMVYDDRPPFEIQETSTIDRATMRQLANFSRVWTLFHNQEKLKTSVPFIWRDAASPFDAFMDFTVYVRRNTAKLFGIDFLQQARLLHDFLHHYSPDAHRARQAIVNDYTDWGRRKRPPFIA